MYMHTTHQQCNVLPFPHIITYSLQKNFLWIPISHWIIMCSSCGHVRASRQHNSSMFLFYSIVQSCIHFNKTQQIQMIRHHNLAIQQNRIEAADPWKWSLCTFWFWLIAIQSFPSNALVFSLNFFAGWKMDTDQPSTANADATRHHHQSGHKQ